MKTRFGTRRNANVIGELVLLATNNSPKASRRLRHSLCALTFGQGERLWKRYSEPVVAAQALAKQVRQEDDWSKRLGSKEETPVKVRNEFDTVPPGSNGLGIAVVRKITGAVRRGLARGKKA